MFELIEFMCQQGDKGFMTLLNSQPIGILSDDHTRMLQLCQIYTETLNNDVIVLLAKNDLKDWYHCTKLETSKY